MLKNHISWAASPPPKKQVASEGKDPRSTWKSNRNIILLLVVPFFWGRNIPKQWFVYQPARPATEYVLPMLPLVVTFLEYHICHLFSCCEWFLFVDFSGVIWKKLQGAMSKVRLLKSFGVSCKPLTPISRNSPSHLRKGCFWAIHWFFAQGVLDLKACCA